MHDDDEDRECAPARSECRAVGRHHQAASDADDLDGAAERGARSGSREDGENDVFAVAAAELFSGPIASPRALRDDELVVGGSARQLIDCHLRSEAVAADAIERVSRAESAAVMIGVIGAQVLTVGALAGAVVLISVESTAAGLIAIVPGVLAAASQLVAAARRRA
ncbi:hypothetical protein [Curtobacterium sp. SORGH_AS_0776]|uniref:hypothetical protein n=1 Tax=Curtobacterium sp. SORGH_AS_0776 TaxID=3041798 RepID=UPI0028629C43|nr:hypothetical protein [Curtobacterium sp. SORGH_AS_0776]MDR6170727.1 hypothetical protein [Curtobacterium sp. SORGH_AS_0776]